MKSSENGKAVRSGKPVTMSRIAAEAGVSTGAVSAMLSNRDYGIRVGEATRNRILEACRRLNYQPNNAVAMTRLYPEFGDVCFLLNSAVPDGTRNHYFGQMLTGVVEALRDPTHPVVYSLYDPEMDYQAHPEKLPQPLRSGTASRFIAASPPNPTLVKAILDAGYPLVYLGHYLDTPGLSCIIPDYAEATRLAVRYLADLGHRRIAYVTGPFGQRLYNMLELQRGFAEGMRECGIPLASKYIHHCEARVSDFVREDLIEAADNLMSLDPRPTAILCMHDSAAMLVSSRLQALGYSVPGDVSVMGCNDEPSAVMHHPALTTVRFPLKEMGKEALAEIDRQILGGKPTGSRLQILPVELIARNSCAPPPTL